MTDYEYLFSTNLHAKLKEKIIVMSLIILDDETPILKGMIIVLIISAVLSVSVFFIAMVLAIVITVLFSFIF